MPTIMTARRVSSIALLVGCLGCTGPTIRIESHFDRIPNDLYLRGTEGCAHATVVEDSRLGGDAYTVFAPRGPSPSFPVVVAEDVQLYPEYRDKTFHIVFTHLAADGRVLFLGEGETTATDGAVMSVDFSPTGP